MMCGLLSGIIRCLFVSLLLISGNGLSVMLSLLMVVCSVR